METVKQGAVERKLSLFEKIANASNIIGIIAKNLEIGKGVGKYNAVAEADVLSAVKKAEQENGLLSIPCNVTLLSHEIKESIDLDGHKYFFYVDTIQMTVRIYNLDRPSEFIEITVLGRGVDVGDKGLGKASTYARKYALMNAYKIVTGEDADAEKSVKQESISISDMKVKVFDYLAQNHAKMQTNLKSFACESIDYLTEDQIKTIYDSYHKKGML